MQTPLYIFGTDHRYQCGGLDCTPDQLRAFHKQISTACQNHSIQRVAEEMTFDGRTNYEVEETIAQIVAREFAIHHHDVDLTSCERQALSISVSAVLSAKSAFRSRDGGAKLRAKFDLLADQVRERVWAARIMNSPAWPVLFIVGADHVTSFCKVWRRLGGTVIVLCKNYAP